MPCEPGKCEGHVEGQDMDELRAMNEAVSQLPHNRYFSVSLMAATPEQRQQVLDLVMSFDTSYSVFLEDPIEGEVEVDVEVTDGD